LSLQRPSFQRKRPFGGKRGRIVWGGKGGDLRNSILRSILQEGLTSRRGKGGNLTLKKRGVNFRERERKNSRSSGEGCKEIINKEKPASVREKRTRGTFRREFLVKVGKTEGGRGGGRKTRGTPWKGLAMLKEIAGEF